MIRIKRLNWTFESVFISNLNIVFIIAPAKITINIGNRILVNILKKYSIKTPLIRNIYNAY